MNENKSSTNGDGEPKKPRPDYTLREIAIGVLAIIGAWNVYWWVNTEFGVVGWLIMAAIAVCWFLRHRGII